MARIMSRLHKNVESVALGYRRPSKRGGAAGPRELVVADIARPKVDGDRTVGEQRVPFIRLSGLWLEERGFRVGRRVEITEEPQRLILTVVDEQ